MRHDLPDCVHNKNERNFSVLRYHTSDPEPHASDLYKVTCNRCFAEKITRFERGIKQ